MIITHFQQIGPYQLRVWFSDGTDQIADFSTFLAKSRNTLIRQFLDPERFASVVLDEQGILVWGDDEMDINPASIYDGLFSSKAVLI